MSKINRDQIKKLVLKEMRMLGMADMVPMGDMGQRIGCDACGMSPCACDEYEDDANYPEEKYLQSVRGKGTVSREDCCTAVLCLIECCECPETRRELEKCCNDIMSGRYDS